MNAGPLAKKVKVFLVPFIIGSTLCKIKELKTIIDPGLLNSGAKVTFFEFNKLNSPPEKELSDIFTKAVNLISEALKVSASLCHSYSSPVL